MWLITDIAALPHFFKYVPGIGYIFLGLQIHSIKYIMGPCYILFKKLSLNFNWVMGPHIFQPKLFTIFTFPAVGPETLTISPLGSWGRKSYMELKMKVIFAYYNHKLKTDIAVILSFVQIWRYIVYMEWIQGNWKVNVVENKLSSNVELPKGSSRGEVVN